MSAKPFLLWGAAAFLGLSALMMLGPVEAPVATLQAGLGPVVNTEPL